MVTLTTPRLTLRPPSLLDAQPMFQTWARDPEAVKYLTWLPHRSLLDSADFIRQALEEYSEDDWIVWMIEKKEDGRIIGSIDLQIDSFRAEFGYVVGRAFWGRGYATEALKAVSEYGFSRPAIHRLWAVCDVENPASARVMEKAGYVREGMLRRFSSRPNVSAVPADVYVYAKIR